MTNPELQRDPASFRDPSGHVIVGKDAVYRLVMPVAAADFTHVRGTRLFPELIKRGWLLDEELVSTELLGDIANNASFVVKHPKLPLVSYPRVWSMGCGHDTFFGCHCELRYRARSVHCHCERSEAI